MVVISSLWLTKLQGAQRTKNIRPVPGMTLTWACQAAEGGACHVYILHEGWPKRALHVAVLPPRIHEGCELTELIHAVSQLLERHGWDQHAGRLLWSEEKEVQLHKLWIHMREAQAWGDPHRNCAAGELTSEGCRPLRWISWADRHAKLRHHLCHPGMDLA